jgi:hypothetical protein
MFYEFKNSFKSKFRYKMWYNNLGNKQMLEVALGIVEE